MRILLLAPLLAALPGTAFAGPLTFDRALALARQNAPALAARAADVAARRASSTAAGQLPDPKAGIGLDNFPVSGPPAFSFDGTMMTAVRLNLQQDVPNLAKRHAREKLADAAIDVAEANAARTDRQIMVATAGAWVDLAYAHRRLGALDAVLAKLQPLVSAATRGVASGGARPAQSLAIQQAIAALEDRRSALVADIEQARATLAQWTGDADPDTIGDIPDFALEPARLQREIDAHPSLRVADASVREAQAGVAAAHAEKRPDWGFSVGFGGRSGEYGNLVSVGATVTLPLFAAKRQNPRIAAADATAAAARADREDARRALDAALERGLAVHRMEQEQWQRARDTLLPLAEHDVQLETASYAAGRAGLIDVIAAQTALANTRLDVLDREARVVRQAADVALTFGSDSK